MNEKSGKRNRRAERNGRLHAGRVTLADVAQEVGLHYSTVSRALDPEKSSLVREDTRLRIMDAADRIGYRPHMIARGLTTGRTATIGIIAADLGNTWVTPIIHGITARIESAGSMPVIAETQDSSERFAEILNHMLSRQVDAVIALAARTGDVAVLQAAARTVPVVVAARPLDRSGLTLVTHADAKGAALVAEHLAALGHRTVVQLAGPQDVLNFKRRYVSFSKTAQRLGMDEVQIDMGAHVPVESEGHAQMEELLERTGPWPTAVFAANDAMALGAIAAARERGLAVPEDLSVVGYNDLPLVRHLSPPLTTVRYPGWDVGYNAGRVCLELLAGRSPKNRVLEAPLIIRDSTAKPRNSA